MWDGNPMEYHISGEYPIYMVGNEEDGKVYLFCDSCDFRQKMFLDPEEITQEDIAFAKQHWEKMLASGRAQKGFPITIEREKKILH